MKTTLALPLCHLPFLLFGQALAMSQNPEVQLSLQDLLDLKITIASTKATTVFKTPSTVSVIDEDMIKKYNFHSVAEALDVLAGIKIYRTTTRMGIITSRGILQDHYQNKVLTMVNGAPFWSPVTGEAGSINRINIADVERIEILKGPASVLYGTNAYTGAVNIVTKKIKSEDPESTAGQVSGAIGSEYAFGGGGHFMAKKNDLSIFTSASGYAENGIKRTFQEADSKTGPGMIGHFNDYDNIQSFTLGVGYKIHNLFFNGYKEEQQKYGVDPYYALGLGKPQNTLGYIANYNNKLNIIENLDLKTNLTFDWNQCSFPRNQDFSVATDMEGYRTAASVLGMYNISEYLSLDLGADYDQRKSVEYKNYSALLDTIITQSNLQDRSVYEASASAQANVTISDFSLLAGSRYTKNEHFGQNVSSRATAVYSINDKNSVKLIAGQSFRAPSLFEVFFLNPDKSVVGNTDLKPETAKTFEFAYLASVQNFFAQGLVYYSIYDNKIFRISKNSGTGQNLTYPDGSSIPDNKTYNFYINGHEFSATGIELETKYQSKYLDIFANYNYVIGTKGDTTGSGNANHYNFKYIPQHTLSVGASGNYNGFFASALLKYSSAFLGGESIAIDAQQTIDLNAGYTHKIGNTTIRHTLSVKNALDEATYFPEYVDRVLNAVPGDFGRRVSYDLQITY